jgi:tetratricopeptide (TPR) repeat protein
MKKNPDAHCPRWFLAEMYAFHQKNEEARREYFQLEKLGYMDHDEQFALGKILYRLKQYDEAITRFERVASFYPDDKAFNYYMGMSYMARGVHDKALRHLIDATKAAAGDGLFFRLRKRRSSGIDDICLYEAIGDCFSSLGQFEMSAEAYRKALSFYSTSRSRQEIKNKAARSHVCLANLLLEKDRKEEAIGHLRLALQVQPEHSISEAVLRRLTELGVQAHT